MEYFSYSYSMIKNDARCVSEIKSRIAMARVAFTPKKTLFTSKLDLNLGKKIVISYIWKTALYDKKKLETLGSKSEIPAKF